MKYLKNDKELILNTLETIYNSKLKENSHLFGNYGNISIINAVKKYINENINQDFYPAIIFIRVVLAANRNYNLHVKKNIDNIKNNYPNLKSLGDLNELISSKSIDEFYKFWGHKNLKKYIVLKNLIDAAFKLKLTLKVDDDFELMKKWAENINIYKLQNDEIGKIQNVALATVQHLRMDFGIDTVKPDQRVLEVLEREFINKKVSQKKAIKIVEELSKISGLKVRELDLILVNYGSGYYDNRIYNSKYLYQIETAKKLLKNKIKLKIISEVTNLTIDDLKNIKKNNQINNK